MTATMNTPQAKTNTTGSWYPPQTKAVSGPLLVATDGSSAGEAAFRAAATIVAKLSTSVEVLIVVEPLPVLVPDPSVVMQPLVASPSVLEAYREGILCQLREIAPPGLEWRVEVEYGRPSSEIANQGARTQSAAHRHWTRASRRDGQNSRRRHSARGCATLSYAGAACFVQLAFASEAGCVRSRLQSSKHASRA